LAMGHISRSTERISGCYNDNICVMVAQESACDDTGPHYIRYGKKN